MYCIVKVKILLNLDNLQHYDDFAGRMVLEKIYIGTDAYNNDVFEYNETNQLIETKKIGWSGEYNEINTRSSTLKFGQWIINAEETSEIIYNPTIIINNKANGFLDYYNNYAIVISFPGTNF